jgi:tryptophan synthase alpha chain
MKIIKKQIRKSNIDNVFLNLKKSGKKAFIPFITCGYPDIGRFLKLFKALEKSGADIIEIGIPFSDPLADGPIIQETSRLAIENGVNTDTVFDTIGKIRTESSIPIVILTYFNPVYQYGIEKFLSRLSEVKVDGLIIPDLPLEEYKTYSKIFNNYYCDIIMLASLTSRKTRLEKIIRACQGFLYCVSVKGVTGTRNGIKDEVKDFLIMLRGISNIPLALGFGLSGIEQIYEIKEYCDAIIVGSKILSLILNATNFDDGLSEVEKFVKDVNRVLK